MPHTKLKLLPLKNYGGVNQEDPIKYYFWPFIGSIYRRRVEMCLDKCPGGEKILEIGFGTGLTFINLNNLYGEIHGIDLTADIDTVKSIFSKHGIETHLKKGNVLDLPYKQECFDTVLLISILEHLKPDEQIVAFSEIWRVLKPGGRVVYGVPVERPFMEWAFQLMGVNIRDHHYSTEKDVYSACEKIFGKGIKNDLIPFPYFLGGIYEVGTFEKKLS